MVAIAWLLETANWIKKFETKWVPPSLGIKHS